MKYHLLDFNISRQSLLIIFISLVVFILSCTGLLDSFSLKVSHFLYHWLGYTNKWSRTYGEPWFVNLNSNISSFGSREIVFSITVFFSIYLFNAKNLTKVIKFLSVVLGGILLIFLIKYINSNEVQHTFKSILIESLSNFPSGHAFITLVLYVAIAFSLQSRKYPPKINNYFYIVAFILVIAVGISRIILGAHTVTEVVAGWSLGVFWLSFINLILNLKPAAVFYQINK